VVNGGYFWFVGPGSDRPYLIKDTKGMSRIAEQLVFAFTEGLVSP
jgi:hypothetical protein